MASTAALMERITDSQTHVIEVLDAARLLDQRGVLAAAHAATDDQHWRVMERITRAALDCGDFELAERCTSRVTKHLPGSSRAALLFGLSLEAKGRRPDAKRWYEGTLEQDENDDACRERLLMLELAESDDPRALIEHLETGYHSLSGWSFLADWYCTRGQYSQAMTALSHALVLAPLGAPSLLLKHAEVAYTLMRVHLAYAHALRVVELIDLQNKGLARRAAILALLCIARLRTAPGARKNASEEEQAEVGAVDASPAALDSMQQLLTALLLDTKAQDADQTALKTLRKWLAAR